MNASDMIKQSLDQMILMQSWQARALHAEAQRDRLLGELNESLNRRDRLISILGETMGVLVAIKDSAGPEDIDALLDRVKARIE